MSKHHGTSTIEIERKYDVAEDAQRPAFVGVGPIAVIEAPEVRELDAVYYDTEDFRLANANIALRRREGGPDAGWHIKRDLEEGRLEQHWPLAEGEDDGTEHGARGRASVPAALLKELGDLVQGDLLMPVARVRNHRVVSRLLDAAGYPVAEYCDDHVMGENLITGHSESWREWEVELSAAAPDSRRGRAELFEGLEVVVRDAGGTPSASTSKLERALRAG